MITIGLYRSLLGDDFDSLHPHLRRAHEAPLDARGTADVRGARGPAALLARAMRLPRCGDGQQVRVTVTESGQGQVWDRTFGRQRTITRQSVVGGRMVERSGAGVLLFDVRVADGNVVYESVGASLFGICLPKMLAPRARGVVSPTTDCWSVAVTIESPLLGLLCAYKAVLTCT